MYSNSKLKERILNVLRECRTLLAGQEGTDVYRSIVSATERLNEPMQLAIIGKISSSKSTLVNAILGEDEVVKTGYMEETFNVSWLKYGDASSDIRVVFKDGKVSTVPKSNWTEWASHQSENKLKKDVRYIEVFHNHEILKEINIIDTPGLDAESGIDSENTIAFLKEVHPDAVVMLFTKSIAETTLSVVQDFQSVGGVSYSLSPLNAIGVLSKVDLMWNMASPDKDILADAYRIIDKTLLDRYPEVRRALFSILPVSALMGLASATISDDDFNDIVSLSKVKEITLSKMLISPDNFKKSNDEVSMSEERRKHLCDKFGLYGIFVLTNAVRRNKDVTLSLLKETLLQKSGFGNLLQTVRSHFGERASLIKSQSILQDLLRQIVTAKSRTAGEALKGLCSVENILVSTILTMHEYREWECLSKHYNGKLELDEETAAEFTAVCGEKGYSAKERLRLPSAGCSDELIRRAATRALYWQGQYNLFSTIEPDLAGVYRVIISSYNQLIKDIRTVEQEYREAKEKLQRSAYFLGITEKSYTEP